jgi:hypothetical protein
MVGVVVLSVVFYVYRSTTIRSFSSTCRKHVGICPKRHDIDIVCVWRHESYVADIIFSVADTVDDMSLCRVDWAQKKNDTTPTFPAKGGRGNDDVVVRHDACEEGDVINDDRRERAGPCDVVVPDPLLEGLGGSGRGQDKDVPPHDEFDEKRRGC